ncbi:HtaA domain-containing protein [Streptomyces monticola]|uniref:HtaA domain-containing protein n=1 Tax=Streptomyces monticola TaxID=2666263 RepID=A0ABW2JWL1_9ACTN
MAALRRPIALAAATAVALGATALAVAGPASAAEVPLKDYELTWGIKESYRSYVTGMAAGEIKTADGAEQAADNGPFTFTKGEGTYDSGSHTVDLAFKGGVTFTSKLHGFEVALSDVQFDSAAKKVTADVTKGGKTQQDVPFAEVTVDRAMKDMPTKLTKEADEALGGGGRYTGADGDPLTVAQHTPAPSPTAEPTDEPTAPPTGKPTGKPTATPSASVTPSASASPSTPSASAPKPSSGTGAVVDGSLSWGLKESFRKYIAAGGEVRTAGGAKQLSGGSGYEFPYAKADLDSGAKKLDASFGGSVRFLYKAHGIDMKFGDIKVETNGAKGTLLVDVTTPKGTNDDVAFATLDLSKASYTAKDDVVLLDKVPAKFTAAGAEQFANETTGSMYKAGDPIDPVTVALSLSEGAQLPGGGSGSGTGGGTGSDGGTTGGGSVGGSVGGGSGSLAATGSDVPTGALLGAAGAVVAAGAGVVYAARRRGTA